MRIAVVGAGAITRRGHLPAIFKTGIELAAIVDSNDDTLSKVGEEFGIECLASSIEGVLQDRSIDAVSICTPTPSHFSIANECLKAGKHVLIEKPVAFSYLQARKLVELCHSSGLVGAVVQNWRYFPQVLLGKEKISGGRLGEIHAGHVIGVARFPNGWTRSKWLYHKRGVLYDFAPHAVDMATFLLGKRPKTVFARCDDLTGNMGFVNYAKLFVGFEGGTLMTFDFSWLTGSLVFQSYLHGTSGHLFLDVRNNTSFEFHGSLTPVDLLKSYASSSVRIAKDIISRSFVLGPMKYYDQIYRNFRDAVDGKEPPLVSLEEGLQSNLILDGAFLSSHLKKELSLDEMMDGTHDRVFQNLL